MNYIQTFHIDSEKDPFRYPFGWVAPEYHMMGWALSCLQLQKVYGKVSLFANSQAARLLVDILQLPYGEVKITHDKLFFPHPDLWALPKIYTYSIQEQSFMHIDGDVFLFKPFDVNLMESDLITQNVEIETKDYYKPMKKALMANFTFLPPCVKKDFESGAPIYACNAGIIGGNNVSFFHEYASTVFEYILENGDRLKRINVNSFNVFYEQHLFYALAREKGIPVKVLIEGVIEDRGYKHLDDFHDVPFNRSYIHLLGDFKRDEFTCNRMASKLKELFPDYFERIVSLFHEKNILLSPSGFLNSSSLTDSGNKDQTSKRIEEQGNSHLKRLRQVAQSGPPNIVKSLFQSEFNDFYKKLTSVITNRNYTDEELCKRDLAAQYWYRDLFADTSNLKNRVIVRCRETEMIESSFNWAGLFNKFWQAGAQYYTNMQINKGHFQNLIVFEATDNGFSLYDINDEDYAILRLMSDPLSVNKILLKMHVYFEDDILQNHYDDYETYILSLLKKLVKIKAIQPV